MIEGWEREDGTCRECGQSVAWFDDEMPDDDEDCVCHDCEREVATTLIKNLRELAQDLYAHLGHEDDEDGLYRELAAARCRALGIDV